MLLVASSLALLVVYAGVKLLIQVKREVLGSLYSCVAWFFIAAGFLTLLCTVICCIAMCCMHGARMMHGSHEMMRDRKHDMIEYHKGYKKMMKHHYKEHGDCALYINHCSAEPKCCTASDVCKMDTLKRK